MKKIVRREQIAAIRLNLPFTEEVLEKLNGLLKFSFVVVSICHFTMEAHLLCWETFKMVVMKPWRSHLTRLNRFSGNYRNEMVYRVATSHCTKDADCKHYNGSTCNADEGLCVTGKFRILRSGRKPGIFESHKTQNKPNKCHESPQQLHLIVDPQAFFSSNSFHAQYFVP